MSISLRNRIRQAFLLGCVTGAAFIVLGLGQAAVASADVTSVYPPEAQSRDFAGGEGAWTSAKEQTGLLGGVLCIEGVSCPAITNSHQAGGGVGGSGDGFIETAEGGLTGLGIFGVATSSGTYESPAFTYAGAAGQQPTNVEFSIARRADVSGLLEVSGAAAVYSIELVDETSPSGSVLLTNSAPLAGAEEWKTASASVTPSALVVGHSYKVRIRTTFNTPALVLPAGGAGYDNVSLTATKVESSSGNNGGNGNNGNNGGKGNSGNGAGGNGAGGNNGGKGKNGGNGAQGAGGVSSARLESLLKSSGLVGAATLKGNRLTVKAKCPARLRATCTLRLQGMLNRHKPATTGRRARVKKGKVKNVAMVVKPTARKKVRASKRILVKEIARVGKSRATVYKSLRLVRKK